MDKANEVNNKYKSDEEDETLRYIATTSQLRHRNTLYLSIIGQNIIEKDLHSNNTN